MGPPASILSRAPDSPKGLGIMVRARCYLALPIAVVVLAFGLVPVTAGAKSLKAGPLSFVTKKLPAPTQGVDYSATIEVKGGTPPYALAITSGALPTGLTFNPSADTLSGVPSGTGKSKFTITATDSSAPVRTKSRKFTLKVVSSKLTLPATALPAGTQGLEYSASIPTSGGTPPITETHTSGSLPTGTSLSANGSISGVPSGSGTYEFTVGAIDSSTPVQAASQSYSISIVPSTLMVPGGSLSGAVAGSPYSTSLGISGGVAPYFYNVVSGSVPGGLSAANDQLSGVPDKSGSYSFELQVSDSSTPTAQSVTATFTVSVGSQAEYAIDTMGTHPTGYGSCSGETTDPRGGAPAGKFVQNFRVPNYVNTITDVFIPETQWLSYSVDLYSGGTLIASGIVPKAAPADDWVTVDVSLGSVPVYPGESLTLAAENPTNPTGIGFWEAVTSAPVANAGTLTIYNPCPWSQEIHPAVDTPNGTLGVNILGAS